MAFAVAASSFCPLLLLGIWWRGLTDVGAMAGLVLVAAPRCSPCRCASAATPAGLAVGLLAQPAAVTVPLAFATMIGVSLLTRRRRPDDVTLVMMRMHAPEARGEPLTGDRSATADRPLGDAGPSVRRVRAATWRHHLRGAYPVDAARPTFLRR